MITLRFRGSAILSLLLALGVISPAQDRLVNMVPNSRSGETGQDAEPTITVDPNNDSRIVGSAFTWDNLTDAPMVTATAPIYVSSDGGNTWTMAFIVPSKIGSAFPTGDITLSFSSTLSGATAHQTSWLYAGTLSATASPIPMTVLRAQDPYSATLMATLDTQTGNVDQPHTISMTGAGQDKLYVGFNKGWGCIAPGGRSSSVDVSQDGKIGTPTFTLDVIDARNTACQDGFAQVPAVHSDGTVYAAFIHDWNGTPRLVVVRDDNWATGPTPFTALTDPSDSNPGRFVTAGLTLAAGVMGQNRLGASNVSIAVDPNNSDRVYVAWGDSGGSNTETIHVQRSIDRGKTWVGDLMSVTNAMNPEVAIANDGIVGVLYQQVAANRWETRLSLSTNLDATSFNIPGKLLANQDATTPASTYWPYIGDYASLVASGDNFVGMFSASNYPDSANFMSGVKYQREVDWSTHKLFADGAHTQEVAPSVDPFFFEVGTSICNRIPVICENICFRDPRVCFPIYDPWWWLKCPECGIQIFVNPGEEYQHVTVYNTLGKEVGELHRLEHPVVEHGITYTYSIRGLKSQKDVGYVLKAHAAGDHKVRKSFAPKYFVKLAKSKEKDEDKD